MEEAPSDAEEMDGFLAEAPAPRERPALSVPHDVEDLLRELAPQVLGVLARRYGRLRRGRGRRPGGAARRRRALARRGDPGPAAGLADPDRVPAADRPAAQRAVPDGAGRTGRC